MIEDATIVFRRGRVARVGRGARPASGGRVIDVGGAFVLPGLFAAHVHVSTVSLALTSLLSGATTIRSASAPVFQDVGLRALAQTGEGRAPRTFAAGVFVTPFLGDTVLADPRLAVLATLPDGVRSPQALRFLVSVNLDRGVDVIKTRATERAGVPEQDPRTQVYDETQLRAVVEAARRGGASVLCHAHGDSGARAAVAAGVRSIEHGTFMEEPTLDLMVRKATFLTPTASGVVALSHDPNPILAQRGREMLVALRQVVAAAHAKRIPIVAGTDIFAADEDITIAGEIRLLAGMGLSNLDAIGSATTTAAAVVDQTDRIGRLQPGFVADAIVIGGDPLSDLAALDDLRMIVAGGWVAKE